MTLEGAVWVGEWGHAWAYYVWVFVMGEKSMLARESRLEGKGLSFVGGMT